MTPHFPTLRIFLIYPKASPISFTKTNAYKPVDPSYETPAFSYFVPVNDQYIDITNCTDKTCSLDPVTLLIIMECRNMLESVLAFP